MNNATQAQPLTGVTTALRARWLIAAVMLLLGLVAGSAYAGAAPETYEAGATVQIGGGLVNLEDAPGDDESDSTSPEREVIVATSRTVLVPLAEELGVARVSTLKKRLSVTNPGDTELLEISYEAPARQAAVLGANAAARSYLDLREVALGNRLDTRVAGIKELIRTARSELASAKTTPAAKDKVRPTRGERAARSALGSLQRQLSRTENETVLEAGSIIESASGTGQRTSLPLALLIALGAAAGLVLGIVLAYLAEAWRPRVRKGASPVTTIATVLLGRLRRRDGIEQAAALLSIPATQLKQAGGKRLGVVAMGGILAGSAEVFVGEALGSEGAVTQMRATGTDGPELVNRRARTGTHLGVYGLDPKDAFFVPRAASTDGFIVLARENVTRISDLNGVLETLRSVNVDCLGVLTVGRRGTAGWQG